MGDSTRVRAVIVNVLEKHVEIMLMDNPVWWLSDKSAFRLPKDSKLSSAKVGDEIVLTLT